MNVTLWQFIPPSLCVLCNLPHNSQHSLQWCTVAGSRHRAAVWWLQCAPDPELSHCCTKSHQSVAPQCLKGAVLYTVTEERSRQLRPERAFIYLGTWMLYFNHIQLLHVEVLLKASEPQQISATAHLDKYIRGLVLNETKQIIHPEFKIKIIITINK